MAKGSSPSDTGLYGLIEAHLKKAGDFMSCIDLFDKPDINARADDVQVVSNALGYMWRMARLVRRSTPRSISGNNYVRWEYALPPPAKQTKEREVVTALPVLMPRDRDVLVDRPEVKITEDGKSLRIDLPSFTITIQTK